VKNLKQKAVIFILSLFSLFAIHYSLFSGKALAHCPLCVAGAGVGLTLSRFLGIDDSITGIWMGTFLGASSLWLQNILKVKLPIFSSSAVGLLMYVGAIYLTIVSFYKFNLISTHGDIFGFDKLAFGIILGSIIFFLSDSINGLIMKVRQKSFFPYQRLLLLNLYNTPGIRNLLIFTNLMLREFICNLP